MFWKWILSTTNGTASGWCWRKERWRQSSSWSSRCTLQRCTLCDVLLARMTSYEWQPSWEAWKSKAFADTTSIIIPLACTPHNGQAKIVHVAMNCITWTWIISGDVLNDSIAFEIYDVPIVVCHLFSYACLIYSLEEISMLLASFF